MNFKSYLLAALGLASLCMSSCSDDDDTSYSETDPRIRVVSVQGVSTTFVVNDVEHIIYNYDSLTCGTDVSNMLVSFYGYDGKISIDVYKNGEWETMKNDGTDTLDLRDLKIRTTSQDGSNTYEYTFAMRVHQYDVNAFDWSKIELPVKGTVASGKALELNGKYYYFYTTTSGDCNVLASADGSGWTNSTIDKADYDWTSLQSFNDKAVVLTADGIATIDPANSNKVVSVTTDVKPSYLLFELDGKFWAIADGAVYNCSDEDFAFSKVSSLPSDFPTEGISTLVTSSGKYSNIGYIYGLNGSTSSVWGLDADGNLLKLGNSSSTSLPVFTGVALSNIDDEIGIIGGKDLSGDFHATYFTSSDAGLNWTNNWHKDFSSTVGQVANLSAIKISSSKLLFIGGENAKGATSSAWLGVLRGSN